MKIFKTNWLTVILEWIETNEMSLFLSILSVACEAPITTKVLMLFGLDYFHAWSSCMMLSFGIIFFTVKKSWITIYFALIETIFCGYFFCNQLGWSLLLIPAAGFTFIMPFSIYAYSQGIKLTIKNLINPQPVIVIPKPEPEPILSKVDLYNKKQMEDLEKSEIQAKEQIL